MPPPEFKGGTVEVPKGATEFTFDGTKYKGGDKFTSTKPCDIVGFGNAFITANPKSGKANVTPQAWESAAAACSAQQNTSAGETTSTPSGSSASDGGLPPGGTDSAADQGAPQLTQPPLVAGDTTAAGVNGGQGNTVNVNAGNGNTTPPPGGTPSSTGGDGSSDPSPTSEPKRPDTGTVNPDQAKEKSDSPMLVNDPVELFSGAFTITETDLAIVGTVMPLQFTRGYRSGPGFFGPLGWNWDHNFNVYLRELTDGDVAVWRWMHEDLFHFDGATYEPRRGLFERLERVGAFGTEWEITGVGGTITDFERPPMWIDGERIPIAWVRDRHGNELRFTYGDADHLVSVADTNGNALHFDYDECGLLVAVSDHTGRRFLYEHDEETMHLTCVTTPPITDHPDGIRRRFDYEETWAAPELRHAILRVIDGDNRTFIENTYDTEPASLSYGRVLEQYYGGYLHQYRYVQLQVVPALDQFVNVPAWQVEVMNPDYGVDSFTFNFRGDLLDQRHRLVKDFTNRVVARMYEYDTQGQLREETRPDGSSVRYTRDDTNPDPLRRGLVTKVEEFPASGFPVPSRIVHQATYDPDYQLLITETDETGAVTTYVHDFNRTPGAPTNTGKLLEIVRPPATLPDGTVQASSVRYECNGRGLRTATVTADGTRTEFTYGTGIHATRVISSVVDPGGLAITSSQQFDGTGQVVSATDPTGAVTTNVVNALGLTERTTLPTVDGVVSTTVMHYDRDRRLVSVERPRGDYDDPVLAGRPIEDHIVRDELGNPIRLVLGANTAAPRVITTTYDYRSAPTRTVHPDGSRVDNTYDERGLLIRRTRRGTDGTTERQRWAYDRAGRLMDEITEGLGIVRHHEYDPFGRPRRVTHLNGTVHEVDLGLADRPSATRAIGDDGTGTIRLLEAQAFTYDELGRTVTHTASSFDTNPGAAVQLTTTTTYDQLDRPRHEVDHRGGTTTRSFDAAGRLVEQVDAAGNRVVQHLDDNGRVVQLDQHWQTPTGPVTITSRQVFDLRGRLRRTVHADGSAQEVEYDARDLPVVLRDETGVENRTTYNAFAERVAEIVDPAGLALEHRWTLDAMGRSTAYTDPTGQVTVTMLDGLGRVRGQDHPAGNTMRRTFDALGRVTAEWTGAGNRFEYQYDATGRLAQITNTGQAPAAVAVPARTFRYDGLDRLVGADSAGQPSAAVARRFDSFGRLRLETSNGVTVRREYDDLAGHIDTVWADGRRERTMLDPLGRVAAIEETAHGTLGSGGALPLALGTFGQLGPHLYGRADLGTMVIDKRIDDRGMLTDIECRAGATVLEHLSYRFDVRDRIGLEARLAPPNGNRVALLDPAGRMTTVRANAGAAALAAAPQRSAQLAQIAAASATAAALASYTYDGADTIVGWSVAGQPPATALTGPGHRYQSIGGTPATYEADGTLTRYGSHVVVSDALGRVVGVADGAASSLVRYDALGRVAGVTDGGVDEQWVYFGNTVVEERRAGVPHAQFTRLHDSGELVCRHVAGARQLTLTDLRGSLRGVFSAAGAPLAWYDYAPYGAVTLLDAAGVPIPSGTAPMPAVFGGMRHLPATGVLLAGRRVYEPELGIFLSPDPFGNADSANLYTFAAGDPFNRVDPDGELAFLAILGIMAIGALVGGGLNATRQGIAMAENPARRAQGFSWTELLGSMGMGAVAAPILVLAPELAIPMVGMGVISGANEIGNGNYATGTFDIVTSLAPFGSKNVRAGAFGKGTYPGQWRGLGPKATWSERWARFDTVTSNPRATLEPAPFGEEVGIGFARPPGADAGHSGVVIDLPDGRPMLFHKNAQESLNPNWRYEAQWKHDTPLPADYFNGRARVPWDYTTSKVPRSMWRSMLDTAVNRQSRPERFAFKDGPEGPPMSCGYFTGDVFTAGGVNGVPIGNSKVVFPFISQLLNTRNATSLAWGAGFWAKVPGNSTPNRKCVPGQ